MLPRARLALFTVAQIKQSRQLRIGHRHDIAAMAAMAAIGRTAPDKFGAVKAHAARPAVAGFHLNFSFVNKFHECVDRAKMTGPKKD